MRRRQVLKAGGATLAAPLLAPLMRPLDAFAKTEQIVVMTWGGQWGDAMRDNVDAAFEKATGIKVDFTLLPVDPWRARLRAELGAGSGGIASLAVEASSFVTSSLVPTICLSMKS